MIRNVTKGVTTPGRHRQVTSRSAAHRPATLVALVMAALLFTATAATAQWSSVGFGTGSAAAATLAAPTNVSATAAAGGSTVSLSWTPSAQSPSQVAPQGYYVTRMDGGTAAAACGTTVAALTTTASCTDLNVPNGTYSYLVTAVYRSWTATSIASNPVTVRAAAKLAFSAQPSATVAGTSISPAVAVTLQDAAGIPVAAAGFSVTVNIGSNPVGGTLSGTATAVTNAGGVASFGGLSIDKAGTGYTLTGNSSGLTAATSSAFAVSAAAASQVVFAQQPTSAVAGVGIAPAVTVRIVDQFGNLTASTAAVTVAIGTNPGVGTLSGTSTQSAVAGVATFAGLSINKAGTGYTLTAVSGSLTGATSSAFTISAGTVSKFAIISATVSGQASSTATLGPITVQQQDALGNPVLATGGGTTVTLTSNSTGTKVFAATSGGSSVSSVTIPAGSSSASY
jgi:hypothetical protein